MRSGRPRLARIMLLLTAFATLPAVSYADSTENPWQFRGQLYLWLPAVSGETSFPPSSGGPGASIDMGDYFSAGNLQSAFMATLEARKGRWGAVTDYIYLHFDEAKSGTRDFALNPGPGGKLELPADVSADADLRLRGWEWTLAGTYGAVSTPQYELQLLGGFRYLKIDTTLTWQLRGNIGSLPPLSAAGTASVKPDYWDAIVGVRGRYSFPQSRWFVPYHFDIGTGDSDLTWQASAALGYAFSWGEVSAAYRHLDYRFASSSPLQRLAFSGPLASVAFRW
jgi:hypothetical protein